MEDPRKVDVKSRAIRRAIIAIIAAALVYVLWTLSHVWANYRQASALARKQTCMRDIYTALSAYADDNAGRFPDGENWPAKAAPYATAHELPCIAPPYENWAFGINAHALGAKADQFGPRLLLLELPPRSSTAVVLRFEQARTPLAGEYVGAVTGEGTIVHWNSSQVPKWRPRF